MTSTERKKFPVVLYIRGEQSFDGAEPDHTELITEAEMEVTEEGFLFSYEETQLTGMEGTTTTVELQGPRVILTREGTYHSRMVFEEGNTHTSLYETPFGELELDIRTNRLRHHLTERGGILEVRYLVSVEHTVTGRNIFRLRVSRKH